MKIKIKIDVALILIAILFASLAMKAIRVWSWTATSKIIAQENGKCESFDRPDYDYLFSFKCNSSN